MPIVVDPGFVWPPEVDPVVSPDGRLTAIVDPAHAGVLLRADYAEQRNRPADEVEATNLVTNPSFETSATAGWTTFYAESEIMQSSYPAMEGRVGDNVFEAKAVGNRQLLIKRSDPIPVTPGKWVSVRAWIATDTGRTARIYMGFDSVYHGTPFTPADFYAGEYFNITRQVPDGSTQMSVDLQMHSGDSGFLPAGARMWVDQVCVVVADTQADAEAGIATYFDGDAADGTGDNDPHYRWTGTPHASTSEKYLPANRNGVTKIRFERQDGTVVRSGNPAWAPGGWAHAYDHEATLGGGTLWRAVPILFDGTEGTPSEYVGAVIPALSDGWAWLKPVTDPDKAMLLKVEPPDLSYDGRVDTTSIAGAARPAATWDVLEGFTTQLRSLVREKDVEEQLKALLDEGPVLAQFPACAGLPDFYFIRGKLDLEHVHWDGWPWRRYQWDVIQIDRPDTTDSPLRIPGLSYDTVERDWTTYDQLRSTVESYNKLLEP